MNLISAQKHSIRIHSFKCESKRPYLNSFSSLTRLKSCVEAEDKIVLKFADFRFADNNDELLLRREICNCEKLPDKGLPPPPPPEEDGVGGSVSGVDSIPRSDPTRTTLSRPILDGPAPPSRLLGVVADAFVGVFGGMFAAPILSAKAR
jgi:hypothetical protein